MLIGFVKCFEFVRFPIRFEYQDFGFTRIGDHIKCCALMGQAPFDSRLLFFPDLNAITEEMYVTFVPAFEKTIRFL